MVYTRSVFAVHRGDGVEPAGIDRGVGGKFGGEPARERHAHVHALHVERLPALGALEISNRSPLVRAATWSTEGRAGRRSGGRSQSGSICIEDFSGGGVVGVEPDRLPRRAGCAGAIAAPPGGRG